jgi:hypothetical protein
MSAVDNPTAAGAMTTGRGATGAAGLAALAAGAAARAAGAPEEGGAGVTATGAADAGRGAVGAAALGPMDGAGPPGANVGNLIVGAAVGLGGKLIRTVSFFG